MVTFTARTIITTITTTTVAAAVMATITVMNWLEFYGEGAAALTLGDRATISNMAPEYGATAAMFYIDQQTIDYLKLTGREDQQVQLVENHAKVSGLWGDSLKGAQYERNLSFDLSSVVRNMAGPSNPRTSLPPPAGPAAARCQGEPAMVRAMRRPVPAVRRWGRDQNTAA